MGLSTAEKKAIADEASLILMLQEGSQAVAEGGSNEQVWSKAEQLHDQSMKLGRLLHDTFKQHPDIFAVRFRDRIFVPVTEVMTDKVSGFKAIPENGIETIDG